VDVEEPVGEVVAHDDARLEGEEVRSARRVVPHRHRPVVEVALRERERHELHVEGRTVLECRDEEFVGVAGEGHR